MVALDNILLAAKELILALQQNNSGNKYSEPKKPDSNNLALDRTVLANERTYQAWIRTGLAALISALGIEKFMNDVEPVWPLMMVTIILLIFSAAAFLLSAWRYEHLHVKISHLEVDLLPVKIVKVLSILLASCSVLAIIDLLITTSK